MENKNNNIEYYKSLISDEEVIKALIQDSKEREGELPKEKTRVRPNINFFQRTVSNLVSSNKRIAKHDEGLQKYYDECECDCYSTPKMLSRKISFSSDVSKKARSDEEGSITSPEPTTQKVRSPEERSTSKIKENMKNYIEKKRNKIRRLKLEQDRLQKLKELSEVQKDLCGNKNNDCSKNVIQDEKRVRRCSDSSESVVSLSSADTNHSNDNVITLSDSESECGDKKDTFIHDLCTHGPSESSNKRKREINV